MLDLSTEFGSRVEKQLEAELVIWLTTAGPDGTPQPRPVWFFWDGTSLLTYSRPKAYKLRHIKQNPKVSLNFNTDSVGSNVAVLTGEARIDAAAPRPDQHTEYLGKYRERMSDMGITPSQLARNYSVPIRVKPERMRGF